MLGVFPGNHSYHTINVTVVESVGEPTHKSAAPCWLNVTSVLPYTVNNYYQFPTCHCHISPHSKLPPPTAWSTPPDSTVFFLCEGGGSWLSFLKAWHPYMGLERTENWIMTTTKKTPTKKKKKKSSFELFCMEICNNEKRNKNNEGGEKKKRKWDNPVRHGKIVPSATSKPGLSDQLSDDFCSTHCASYTGGGFDAFQQKQNWAIHSVMRNAVIRAQCWNLKEYTQVCCICKCV